MSQSAPLSSDIFPYYPTCFTSFDVGLQSQPFGYSYEDVPRRWILWDVVTNNLTPGTHGVFDPTQHTCRGDVSLVPPGLLLIIHWLKTTQTIGLTLTPKKISTSCHYHDHLSIYEQANR